MTLAWILALALAWAALVGELSVPSLLVGAVLGYLTLAVRRHTRFSLLRKTALFVEFVFFITWEVMVANLRVARDVLLPMNRLHPGVVRIPLDIHGEGPVTALANMLTLTPGTVTIDVSDDTGYLYMHVMDLDDPDRFRRGVKRGYERRMRRLLR